jgi:hypothetical protein
MTRTLTDDYALKANSTAYMVQDDLENTFRRRRR